VVTNVSDELFLAWVAGFFDGEGSVIVEYSKSPESTRGWRTSLHATLTQTSLPCLELVQSRLGGTVKTSDNRTADTRRWAVQYTWSVRNQNAIEFLQKIEPYSVVKKEQINLALTYPMFDSRGKKYGNKGNPIPDDIWKKRLDIKDGLRSIRASMKTAAKVRHDA
jgi:hypothetical protein